MSVYAIPQYQMIQHILSAAIFDAIFDEPRFPQENNIASEDYRLPAKGQVETQIQKPILCKRGRNTALLHPQPEHRIFLQTKASEQNFFKI